MTDSANNPPKSHQKSSHAVGYGHPPKAHQFKLNNKASRGRRKGTKNRAVVIQHVLLEPIKVKEGDKVKKMPTLEAIIRQTCNKALKGDHKAALVVIGLAQKEGLITAQQQDSLEDNMSEADKAILADFKKRLGKPEL